MARQGSMVSVEGEGLESNNTRGTIPGSTPEQRGENCKEEEITPLEREAMEIGIVDEQTNAGTSEFTLPPIVHSRQPQIITEELPTDLFTPSARK